MHGVAPHPRAGRVGPGAAQRHHAAASCPGTRPRARRRSARPAGRRRPPPARAAARTGGRRPLCAGRHLLAGVEHPGHVDGRVGARSAASSSMTASPPFMSAEPRPHSTSPSMRGVGVAVGRHRVEVAGDDQPQRSAEVGAGHDVVADPLDGQVPRRRGAARSTWSARAASCVALRGDGHQVGGARRAGRSRPPRLRCRRGRPVTGARRRDRRGRRGGAGPEYRGAA